MMEHWGRLAFELSLALDEKPLPRATGTPVILKGHEGRVTSVALSQDGTMVAGRFSDGAVWTWPSDGSTKDMPESEFSYYHFH